MLSRALSRPLARDLARAVNGVGYNVWSPVSLFALGEQGAWYDPSDLTTLYQDSAGTIPVTAHGQPVGLMLDKSKGLVQGGEKITDGGFEDPTKWITPAGFAVSGGRLSADGSGTGSAYQGAGIESGRWYEVSFDVVAVSGGAVTFFCGNTATQNFSTVGSKRYVMRRGTNANVGFNVAVLGTTFSVDNLSVRELPGNHANQSTTAQRPLLRDTPRRIDYDAVDDSLGITFPSSLGSNCTVARSIPGVGAQILTAQTIGTSFVDNTDNCSLIIVNRALTAAETANLTRYLNQRAGV